MKYLIFKGICEGKPKESGMPLVVIHTDSHVNIHLFCVCSKSYPAATSDKGTNKEFSKNQ